MTVLSAVQQACTVIGIPVAPKIYGSDAREHIELAALANEMAARIVQDFDWQRVKTIATLTGTGAQEDFALPADYSRMLKKARMWPSSQPSVSLVHIADSDVWLQQIVTGISFIYPQWTIYGGMVHIRPAPALADQIKYFYISNSLTIDGKKEFTLDADEFLLSERLLKLAIIWQWKANKGMPYAEDMANYQDAFGVLTGNDKGSNIITIGARRTNMDAEYAFPASVAP
jgi:hypothetical protein